MGLGRFFKALFGADTPDALKKANTYVKEQKQRTKGTASRRQVVVVTLDPALRQRLEETLKPVVERNGYEYNDHPSVDRAIGSKIVILDATPATDAKLHGKYDQILRVKKSLNKTEDILCVFGPRGNFKRYPRGTYPSLCYFCFKSDDPEAREADLTVEGLETIEGPTLYNFIDMPAVIAAKIGEATGGLASLGY